MLKCAQHGVLQQAGLQPGRWCLPAELRQEQHWPRPPGGVTGLQARAAPACDPDQRQVSVRPASARPGVSWGQAGLGVLHLLIYLISDSQVAPQLNPGEPPCLSDPDTDPGLHPGLGLLHPGLELVQAEVGGPLLLNDDLLVHLFDDECDDQDRGQNHCLVFHW